jgi:hypothetical protein
MRSRVPRPREGPNRHLSARLLRTRFGSAGERSDALELRCFTEAVFRPRDGVAPELSFEVPDVHPRRPPERSLESAALTHAGEEGPDALLTVTLEQEGRSTLGFSRSIGARRSTKGQHVS